MSLPSLRAVRQSLLVVICVCAERVYAQDTATTLATVRVSVTREAARPVLELPWALSRSALDSTRAMTRRANLNELLFAVPGVQVSHRFNPTQDPRLSIRGFGARSAFGIRGVRMLRDGIPLTLADGQTAVDALDLETASSAEIMRGSAGALYGNSSGGVVDIRTPAPPSEGYRAGFHTFVADGITRASLNAGVATPLGGWQMVLTSNAGDGPRDYSDFRNRSALLDGRGTLGGLLRGTTWQAQLTYYDSPRAQNPGALTAAELRRDPTLADSNNIRRRAGKSAEQTQLSLLLARMDARGGVSASLFGGTRDLLNPMAFAIVEFDRLSGGATVRGERTLRDGSAGLPLRVSAGVDLLGQRDDRLNFANCAGLSGAQRPIARCPSAADRGVITLNQRERVTSAGAFVRGEAGLSPTVSATGSLRTDRTRFAVADLRSTTFGVAPHRTLGAVTPMVGVNWRASALSAWYANYAESFETPTTTELANQPDGSGGLNRDLKPQHGRTLELGTKGVLWTRLHYDIAVFHVSTEDELIPFEIPNSGGRRFFRNAGRTSRRGIEGSLTHDAGPVTLGTTWTALRYEYDDFTVAGTSFAEKRVPGVTPFLLAAHATTRASWGLAAVEVQYAGRTPVDDANTAYAGAYATVNVRTGLRWGERFGVEPVLGVDNLFDRTYAANVVANAAGGRYFEPGAGRTIYVSLRAHMGKRAR